MRVITIVAGCLLLCAASSETSEPPVYADQSGISATLDPETGNWLPQTHAAPVIDESEQPRTLRIYPNGTRSGVVAPQVRHNMTARLGEDGRVIVEATTTQKGDKK